jgi:hypothetical protein
MAIAGVVWEALARGLSCWRVVVMRRSVKWLNGDQDMHLLNALVLCRVLDSHQLVIGKFTAREAWMR